ncbi:MAG: lysophospholipase [Bacilli bacterium]|nr:lysophospholipase [Bacilli bacterium]
MKKDVPFKNILMIIITFIILLLEMIIITQNHLLQKEITKETVIIYKSHKTIFLGDSITERYNLDDYFHNENYINKGIGGNTTRNILDRLKKDVLDYEPDKVFILIGTNDIVHNIDSEETIDNIKSIINIIQEKTPNTEIFLESIYPVNNNKKAGKNFGKIGKRNNDDIKYINSKLKEFCKEKKITYIDVYDALTNEDGDLSTKYTNDGLHLNEYGYIIVSNVLRKFL